MRNLFCLFLFLLVSGSYAQEAGAPEPDPVRLWNYYQDQEYLKAADYLKSFISDPAVDLDRTRQLGTLYWRGEDYPKAISCFLRCLEQDSTDVRSLLTLARIYAVQEQRTEAMIYFTRALSQDSTQVTIHQGLASVYYKERNLDQAMYHLKIAHELKPDRPSIALDFGKLAMQSNQYLQAYEVYRRTLESHPDHLKLIQGKAEVAYLLKRYPETIDLLERYLELDSTDLSVKALLAASYYRQQEYQTCIDIYQDLEHSTLKMSEEMYYFFGKSYAALNQREKALHYLNKGIEKGLSPNLSIYWFEKGQILEEQERYKRAAYAFHKSLEYKPQPRSYLALARMYDYQMDQPMRAIKNYRAFQGSDSLGQLPPQLHTFVEGRIKALKEKNP